ncbi:MAG: hypothetical protein H6722_14255 [Sandaracinus sp.]|nr:hypothetical protein [Sandaracinus sp.]
MPKVTKGPSHWVPSSDTPARSTWKTPRSPLASHVPVGPSTKSTKKPPRESARTFQARAESSRVSAVPTTGLPQKPRPPSPLP